ncbi:MAG TPA: hypothetical protein VFX63_07455 [Pyrinomonadaceae bacterium]|jgi:hypothetical protein|nr:hypothetical protein [Pyrinomonadaceae bacterium]
MKKIIFIGLIVLAGCAPARTYSPVPVDSGGTLPPAETRTMPSGGDTRTTTPNTLSRDASDCERQAALSTAGSKAEAFNNCMKARRAGN